MGPKGREPNQHGERRENYHITKRRDVHVYTRYSETGKGRTEKGE